MVMRHGKWKARQTARYVRKAMTKKVAVFGCGPSGIVAAYAALEAGADVTVYAKRLEPSHLYGCQYLHAPVPGYGHVPTATVSYNLNGTPEQYREKVYGNKWAGKVSPEDFIGQHQAWDIRETYARLWADISSNSRIKMVVAMVDPERIKSLNELSDFDAVVSTIPAVFLCYKSHEFTSHEIWAEGDSRPSTFADNTILCDGTEDHDWYRTAKVFSYRTVEYSLGGTAPPGYGVSGGARVNKPLSTNCDCFPSITRAGRYGKWDKSVLVSDVYPQVSDLMRTMNGL